MENTEFYAADAGKFMPQLYRQGLVPDVIVMDPVRAGCSGEVLRVAAGMNPKRIIYVSCNPETLHANLATLTQTHRIERAALFDQFPFTPHIESGVLLRRK